MNMGTGKTLLMGAIIPLVFAAVSICTAAASDWPMFGNDAANDANANSGGINAHTVSRLHVAWTFATGGDVSARAAVADGVVYFPDWGGNLWALNAKNGDLVWSHQLSDYGLAPGTMSRTTPAVVGNTVYIGTQQGAYLLAIDAATGALLWKTQLDTVDPFAMITSSPVVVGDVVYTGTASSQESAAGFIPGFVCCNSRGSAVAVDANTGAIRWQTYTVPDGYSGAGIWGSSPVVDVGRETVFVATGDNFSHPTDPAYLACIGSGGTEAECLSPDDHVDSVLALDISTGAIRWSARMVNWNQQGITNGSDDFNVSCFIPPYSNCPTNPGPDYDFGSGVNEITYHGHGHGHGGKTTIIGAGQKSGIYYAFDPDTGAELWQTQVGPGSELGGIEWGSASDGDRIYVAIANYFGIPYAMGSAGSWAALDPATGAILWQVADPNGSIDLGPLAVAKGVVYADSMSGNPGDPTMLALDASNGATLWSFAPGVSVNDGATIGKNMVYWGSGYAHLGIPGFTGGNNTFYAFTK